MEEEIVENPSLLCRVCLNTGNYDLAFVLTMENEKVHIEKMLKEFSSIESGESIPSMICTNCLAQLSDSYMFLRKVQRADEYIKEIFEQGSPEYISLSNRQELGGTHLIGNSVNVITDDTGGIDLIPTVLEGDYDEVIPMSPHILNVETNQHEVQRKSNKRSARTGKKPLIVLTENVSNLLSRVQKSSVDDLIEELADDISLEGEPPAKKQKPTENSSLIVTKFVLQPFNVPNTGNVPEKSPNFIENLEDPENRSCATVSHIQTIDMTAVEVDAKSKISAEEIDDETNIEDPNKIYMCKYCPKAFSTSHHLLMHSRKSHVCYFCTESFVKPADLHKHSKEAHKSFKCSLCEREFSSNSNLRHHIRRVHNINLPAFVSLLSVKQRNNIS